MEITAIPLSHLQAPAWTRFNNRIFGGSAPPPEHDHEVMRLLRDFRVRRRSRQRSSSGYPSMMLAAWTALERRSFCPAVQLDLIVAVNKSIGLLITGYFRPVPDTPA
jgi:hypothetical protein